MQSFRNFIIVFLISTLIFAPCAYFIGRFLVGTISTSINADNGKDTSAVTTDKGGGDEDVNIDEIGGTSFSIMLLGTDYQPELLTDYSPDDVSRYPLYAEEAASASAIHYRDIEADTILIMSVNKAKMNFVLTSIPTETVLNVYGKSYTLGELYKEYGMDFLRNKVSATTGLIIDYYAVVNIADFANLIDMIGGISFYVPCRMSYNDPAQNLYINLYAGTQHLSGEKAAQVLRFNNYTGTTNTREYTTVLMANAILTQMTKSTYLADFPNMYKEMSKYFSTDFTADDLAKNIDLIFAYPHFKVNTIDYPGSYSEEGGRTIFNPEIEKAVALYTQYR